MSGANNLTATREHLTRDLPADWTPIAEDGAVLHVPGKTILRRDAQRTGMTYVERVVLPGGDTVVYQESYDHQIRFSQSTAARLVDDRWREYRNRFGISAEKDDVKFVHYRDGALIYLAKSAAFHSCFVGEAVFDKIAHVDGYRHLFHRASRPNRDAVRLGYDSLDLVDGIGFADAAFPRPIGQPLGRQHLETQFVEIDAARSRVEFSGIAGLITKREARITPHGSYLERWKSGPSVDIVFEEFPYGYTTNGGWDVIAQQTRAPFRETYAFTFAPKDIKQVPFRDGVLFYIVGMTGFKDRQNYPCFRAVALFNSEPDFGERSLTITGWIPTGGVAEGETFVTKAIVGNLGFNDGLAPWPPAA